MLISGAEREPLVIVSVYPGKDKTSVSMGLQTRHRDRRFFRLPPASPHIGGTPRYTVETVHDGIVRTEDYSNDELGAPTRFIDRAVPAEEIAKTLVSHWRDSAFFADKDEGVAPGILLLPRGRTEPTDEEIAELIEQQKEYARRHIQVADELAQKREIRKIGKHHRMWALWLYGEDDPWGTRARELSTQDYTGSVRPANAPMDAMRAEMQALKEQIAKLTAATAKRAPVNPPLKEA